MTKSWLREAWRKFFYGAIYNRRPPRLTEKFTTYLNMMDDPIFEIIDGEKHYKIYYNGQIEGFGKNKGVIVFNRIPSLFLTAIAQKECEFNDPTDR